MGLSLLILINILHAGTPAFMKAASAEVDAIHIVWLRHTLALLVVAPFFLRRGNDQPFRVSEIVRIAVATALAFSIASLLQIESVRRSSASAGAIIVAMQPVAMIGLAVLFLRERLRASQYVGIGVALAGFMVLAWSGRGAFQGSVLYFLAVVCEASLPILLKPVTMAHSPRRVGGGCLLCASMYLLPFQWESLGAALPHMTWHAWTAIAYLGICCSACGMLLWLVSLRRFTVSTMAVAWFLQPVCGSLIACLLLGESLTVRTFVGGGLILGAVWMLCRHEQTKRLMAAHRVGPPARGHDTPQATRPSYTHVAPAPSFHRFLPASRHHPRRPFGNDRAAA